MIHINGVHCGNCGFILTSERAVLELITRGNLVAICQGCEDDIRGEQLTLNLEEEADGVDGTAVSETHSDRLSQGPGDLPRGQ